MTLKSVASKTLQSVRTGLVGLMVCQLAVGASWAAVAQSQASRDNETSSPIKHVIVIVGENRSFDR
jgi:phospholipase C